MALSDHLRELRARLLRSVLVVVVAFSVALFFYDQLLDFVLVPYNEAREQLGEGRDRGGRQRRHRPAAAPAQALRRRRRSLPPAPTGSTRSGRSSCPGCTRRAEVDRGSSRPSPGRCSSPGLLTGYYVLPKAIEVLIGFTPEDVTNLVEFGEFFSFISRMLLVFGIAFEIPLFVVMLNLAGVVSGKALGRYRPWIMIGTFVFAAVATPSTDPFSMLFLAVPMLVLFLDRRGHRPPGRPAAGRGRDRPSSGRTTRSRRCEPRRRSPSWTRSTCPTGWGRDEVAWASDHGPAAATWSPAACPAPADQVIPCDLLAVDQAYPAPVRRRGASAPAPTRRGGTARCCCCTRDDRATLAAPGTSFTAGPACWRRSPGWPGRWALSRRPGRRISP